jgi:TatD DNase family protein
VELIDTHCHLDLDPFDADRGAVIRRAFEAGLVHMITIGIDVESSLRAVELARSHPRISATVGQHPHDVKVLTNEGLDRLKELGRDPEVVGFGEIGLDFFRDHSPRPVQHQRFDDLIHIGLELGLPLVIHDRDAHRETLDHLRSAGAHRGVIHCYSGDMALAREFLDLGFVISLPGTVTFPKALDARDVAREIPLDALLIETDAPFLAPVPFRGRRNEPAYVQYTALEIARLRGMDPLVLAEAATANARRVFGLPRERPALVSAPSLSRTGGSGEAA